MKDIIKHNFTSILVLVFLIVFIILMKACNGVEGVRNYVCDCPVIVETKTDTIKADTVKIPIPIKAQNLVPKVDTVVQNDTFYRDVDTAAILRDYFLLRTYTLQIDTLQVKGNFKFSIWQNKLYNPELKLANLKPLVINTTNTLQTPIPKKRLGFWMGMRVSARHQLPVQPDIAPIIGISDRKDRFYGADYQLVNQRVGIIFMKRFGK